MNPSWGLPAVWKQCLAKGTKDRGQPLATSFPRSACAQAAKISGEGCSLGSHSPVFQRHRWALAFLTTQTDPDIRAAGEWDFARIQLGKNHITKKPHQTKTKPRTNQTLTGAEWMRTSSMFPPPARAGMSQGIISITQQLPRLQSRHGEGQEAVLGSSSRHSHILQL